MSNIRDIQYIRCKQEEREAIAPQICHLKNMAQATETYPWTIKNNKKLHGMILFLYTNVNDDTSNSLIWSLIESSSCKEFKNAFHTWDNFAAFLLSISTNNLRLIKSVERENDYSYFLNHYIHVTRFQYKTWYFKLQCT